MLAQRRCGTEGTVLAHAESIRDARLREAGRILLEYRAFDELIRIEHCLSVADRRDRDAQELRFFDGYMVNLSRPAEKIPFDPEGHSVFLKGVGVKGWLAYMGDAVELGADGRLSWK